MGNGALVSADQGGLSLVTSPSHPAGDASPTRHPTALLSAPGDGVAAQSQRSLPLSPGRGEEPFPNQHSHTRVARAPQNCLGLSGMNVQLPSCLGRGERVARTLSRLKQVPHHFFFVPRSGRPRQRREKAL